MGWRGRWLGMRMGPSLLALCPARTAAVALCLGAVIGWRSAQDQASGSPKI